jgi:ribonuclease HI
MATAGAASLVHGTVHIYTDGSCSKNGTPAAVSGCGVWFGEGDARNVSAVTPLPPHTNQRAELCAVLLALRIVLAAPVLPCAVVVTSDSKYCVDGITSWLAKWEAHGWCKYDGSPVANLDLWQAVRAVMRDLDDRNIALRLVWTKGHASNPGNVAADRLASEAVQRALNSAPLRCPGTECGPATEVREAAADPASV